MGSSRSAGCCGSAPSTYYAARSRVPSLRELRDAALVVEIARVHRTNFGVYGVEKVWRQLLREGIEVGRDRVARLMAVQGLRAFGAASSSAPRSVTMRACGRRIGAVALVGWFLAGDTGRVTPSTSLLSSVPPGYRFLT